MNREQELLRIVDRKVARGIGPEQQYADLNTARSKRKRRAERNLGVIMSGGYKQIPILKCP